MTRELPLPVERAIGDVQALRLELSLDHECKVREALGDTKAAITCTARCAHCCHHPVYLSILEGVLLYRWFAKQGLWTPSFRARIQSARDRTLGLAFDVWLLSNLPCPFLDDNNLCVAYDARPLNCRVTWAMGDPHYCHPHRLGSQILLLPRSDVVQRFHEQERNLLQRLGASPPPLMPLGEAVLLGEALANGTLQLEEITIKYLEHLKEATRG